MALGDILRDIEASPVNFLKKFGMLTVGTGVAAFSATYTTDFIKSKLPASLSMHADAITMAVNNAILFTMASYV